jgi:hypothetical protein
MGRDTEKLLATWFLSLAIVGGLCAPAAALAEPQAIAIVVDRDNPMSDIEVEALRSLFLGKRREWPDGTRAVPVNLEAGPPHHAFCSTVLKMSEADYERYWVDQKVRGAGTGPRPLSSSSLVIRLVARVRGAVGYVPLSRVDGSVKVLSVAGISPGQPGYPLVGDVGSSWPEIGELVASYDAEVPRPASVHGLRAGPR